VERAQGISDPEDHVAILCEVISGVIGGKFPAEPDTDRKLFDKHLRPWVARFFSDLEQAEGAKFYRFVGKLGRTFVEIETEAFAMSA
jgi:TorA maturation chaperone TorD